MEPKKDTNDKELTRSAAAIQRWIFHLLSMDQSFGRGPLHPLKGTDGFLEMFFNWCTSDAIRENVKIIQDRVHDNELCDKILWEQCEALLKPEDMKSLQVASRGHISWT